MENLAILLENIFTNAVFDKHLRYMLCVIS